VSGAKEGIEDFKSGKAARKVDPEDPAPAQILREHASQKRTNASGDSPD
jgi:hypothetical protein